MAHFNNPCIYSDSVYWCKNKNVKRAFGIGARVCKEIPHNKELCPYFEMLPRPNFVPPKGGSGVTHRPIEIKIILESK